MPGLTSVLDTTLSGLDAYRTALNTVSQNISNATTPGYAKRAPVLVTRFDGPGSQAGNGVAVSGVQRMVSQLANARLRSALADQGYGNSLSSSLQPVQSYVSANGGVGTTLDQFLADIKNLSAQPQSTPARATVLADAKQLAGSFRQLAGQLNGTLTGITKNGQNLATQINALLQQLHAINEQLRGQDGTGVNSLLDNQAGLLQTLSGLIGFNVIRNGNGTVRLSVNGQVLLDQSGASTVTLHTPKDGTPSLSVSSGHDIAPSRISGQLGGALQALAQVGSQLQQINATAAKTAAAVNVQQALGLTAAAQQGQALFTQVVPTVFASPVNGGTETLAANLANPAKLPDNGGPFTLRYDGSAWRATNNASGKVQTLGSGPTLTFSGIQVAVSGTPQSGDTFTVDPVASAANAMAVTTTDPDAIAAAVPYVASPGVIDTSGALVNTNGGTAAMGAGKVVDSATGATVVPNATFGQPLDLTFTSATTFEVRTTAGTTVASGAYDPAVGVNVALAYPAGSPAAGRYWQLNLTGEPAAGDSFALTPGGGGSGGNADAMGQLGEATVAGEGLNATWANVVNGVGTAGQVASSAKANAKTNLVNVKAAQQAISGVSLDRQAGDLQEYAQAYQAAAKTIQVVGQLFQGLLQAV